MNRHVSGDYHAVLGDIIVRGGHERSDALMLHFTAPGDDPNYGRAAHYEVRWSEQAFPATAAAFEGLSAQRLYTSPLPQAKPKHLSLTGYWAEPAIMLGSLRSTDMVTVRRSPI